MSDHVARLLALEADVARALVLLNTAATELAVVRGELESEAEHWSVIAEPLVAEPVVEVERVPEPQRAPEWITQQRTGHYYVVVHCPSHLWPGIYVNYSTFALHFKREGRFVTPLIFKKHTTYTQACDYYVSHFVHGAAPPRCYV